MKLLVKLAMLLLITAIQSFVVHASNIALPAKIKRGFIENKGQIKDQNNLPNNEVLYLYTGPNLNVQLKKNGFSYELLRTLGNHTLNKVMPGNYPKQNDPDPADVYVHRIDILFEGCNQNTSITPKHPAPDYTNHFIAAPVVGSTINTAHTNTPVAITGIHHYQKIIYTNIYPNIDIEFILNQGKNIVGESGFKYNFIVKPGGNVNDIRMKFNGALNTSITTPGHISIQTSCGNIDESIPYSYQLPVTFPNALNPETVKVTNEIEGRFQLLSKDLYGVAMGQYDPKQTLVIDPTPWTTYYGGSGDDYAWALMLDTNANAVVAGWSTSTSGIATSGAYQSTLAGGSDVCLLKFNPSGTLQWATYYGGSGNDVAHELTIDANNNILVTGNTRSTSGIATSGAYQTTLGGTLDAFIAKFNSAGALQWGTYFGGSGNEYGEGLGVDSSHNIFVAGYTTSTSGIATSGTYQTTYAGGNYDGYLAKFNESGALQWSTYYGGSSEEYLYSLAIDKSGNASIGGYTGSASGIASSGAFQTSLVGAADAYIAKFNTAGVIQWATYYGGNSGEFIYDLSTDKNNNIIATGYTNSTTGIASSGAYQSILKGLSDAFVVKFNATGALQWSTYYGGDVFDYGFNTCVDPTGNIWLGGTTNSTVDVATAGAHQTSLAGNYDGLLVKFDPTGGIIWGTYYGGAVFDAVYGIDADINGNIYFAGYTASTTGIATTGAYQTSIAGNNDIFIGYLPNPPTITGISNNSIGSDQGVCTGSVPSTLSGSLPLGGDGNFVYSWLSSVTSATSGFALASGVNNTINYSPPALSNTTWYKRVVSSAGNYDTSLTVKLTVGSTRLNVGFTVNKSIQCLKDNLFIFTDTTAGGSNITRLWTFGNGDTSTQTIASISYNFNVANSYLVKLVASVNGACSDSAVHRVFLLNMPVTGQITGKDSANKFSTSTYSVPATIGSSYRWIFTNGTGLSTTNQIAIKWNQTGSTTLKVIELSGGGCKGDTMFKTIIISPATGVEDAEQYKSLLVYPNPSQGFINIAIDEPIEADVNVYDLLGKTVYQRKKIFINHEGLQIDLSGLESGLYTMEIKPENANPFMQKIQLLK